MFRALLVVLPALCLAQPPAFEAATMKPNPTGNKGSSWNLRPGSLTVDNMTLDQIIRAAYSLQDYQYSGPAWLENERYNINATAGVKGDGKLLIAMFQTLLAERLKLEVHHESKSVSGYALTVTKGGLKIQPADGEGWNFQSGKTRVVVTHASLAEFAKFLSNALARPVIDDTGTTGNFTFTLNYADPRSPEPEQSDVNGALPSIFTVITEQLGLKLEPRKVPVDVLVVDHAERPSSL
jgi:uncharacterized protein (TIGR03435 family)